MLKRQIQNTHGCIASSKMGKVCDGSSKIYYCYDYDRNYRRSRIYYFHDYHHYQLSSNLTKLPPTTATDTALFTMDNETNEKTINVIVTAITNNENDEDEEGSGYGSGCSISDIEW
jgi:hypothetical protein